MTSQNRNSGEDDDAKAFALLVERIAHLGRLITEQQALISALLAYSREHPTWNAKRFAALLDQQRVELDLPRLSESDAALKGLLVNAKLPHQ